MNQKVYQFNQQSIAVNAKCRLRKMQSLISQLKDEYNQTIWPLTIDDSIDHSAILSSIAHLSNSFNNISESIS